MSNKKLVIFLIFSSFVCLIILLVFINQISSYKMRKCGTNRRLAALQRNKHHFDVEKADPLVEQFTLQSTRWEVDGDVLADAIIYINLDERTDRKENIVQQLKRQNIPAVRFSAIKHPKGAIGCSLSHLRIVSYYASRNQTAPIVILEDDTVLLSAQIGKDIKQCIHRVEHAGYKWDVILLGISKDGIFQYDSIGLDKFGIYRIIRSQTTTGYIVHPNYLKSLEKNIQEGVDLLLKGEKENRAAIDVYWSRLQSNGIWVAQIPPFITQMDSYSNTTNSMSNYKHSLEFNIDQIDKFRFLNSDQNSNIVVVLQGGLGNLLFQISAAIALSNIHGRKMLLLNNLPPAHDATSTNKLVSLFDSEVVHEITGENWIEPNDMFASRCDLSFLNGTYNTYILRGYFQSSRYWEQYRPAVNKTIERLLDGIDTAPNIPVLENVWGVHIRRGDYLNNGLYVRLWPEYYDKCISDMLRNCRERPNIAIFSNDLEFCREFVIPRYTDRCNVIIPDKSSTLVDFKTMAECRKGLICANSTFSWWCAYFGNQIHSDRPVYIPKNWFNDHVYPENNDLLEIPGIRDLKTIEVTSVQRKH